MKKMKLRNILSLSLLLIIMVGCGTPLPADKSNYAGEWKSKEMYLLILQDGSVKYNRLKNGGNVSITGPIKEFQGDNFIVGVLFLKTTFEVSKPPYKEDGKWKMIVDGIELIKPAYD